LHDVAMRTAIGLAAREKAKISFSVERMVERYREVAADVVGTSTYAGRQANLRTDPSPSKRSHS
jgi:hypothetical protein